MDGAVSYTHLIMGLGLVAFVFDTIGGVMFAKLMNLFLPKGHLRFPNWTGNSQDTVSCTFRSGYRGRSS